MSDISEARDPMADLAASDRRAYFEQRIFVLSPLSDFWTAFVFFAVLAGSFIAIAQAEHVLLFTRTAGGISIAGPARTAFALSVTLSAALFIQRYTRVRERMDYSFFARTLQPGAIERHSVVSLTPGAAQLVPATWLGLVAGIAASWPLYGYYLSDEALPGIFGWFLVVTVILAMSFTRGVELSRTGTIGASNVIKDELIVDLLRVDHLAVWGRSAARFSLIWFTVGAVSCLFFLDSGLNIFTIALVVTFLALGVWVFLRTMQPVHEKIRSVKAAELERVRGEIDQARSGPGGDTSAQLPGLLAYEARIAAVPEWPFDQTTAVRVGASALILTVPWFGQAVAGYAIEHLAH